MTTIDPASLASRRARDVVQAKDPEQMLQALVRYLEVVPGNAVAWTDLAGIFMALQRYGEALDASARALAIDPLQPAGLLHRGTACMKLGRPEEAEEALRK
ncbi:MAG TPA: tetratricopeptide repeat protein, partial [Holophaga sp.]|nr:tetratricopeptide repeat protein [Holophaga sp.]